MANDTPAALRVAGIAKHFGGVRALDGVDLAVAPGEILGLLGPNGSGKTTLVNCVSGVLRPTAGQVRMGDQDITRWSRPRRARAGLVRTYQNLRLFTDLTVAENVEIGLVSSGAVRGAERRRRIRSTLEDQGLLDIARVGVRDLSYGQQRRVEIARALVSDPKVLVLDEPAAGLGEGETEALRSTVEVARDRLGCAVVLIDHDVGLVLGLSDRVAVLHEGRLLRDGSPEEIRVDPVVAETYLGSAEVAA